MNSEHLVGIKLIQLYHFADARGIMVIIIKKGTRWHEFKPYGTNNLNKGMNAIILAQEEPLV